MSAPASARVETASLAGMALGISAYSLFAVHDAMIKGVIATLPAPQILFVRGLVVVLLCLVMGRTGLVRDLIHSRNHLLILGRGLMTLAAWVMYYSAGRELQLAEMTTLYYVAPIMPANTVYIGAFLVVAAGLTLALSEHRSRRELIDAP